MRLRDQHVHSLHSVDCKTDPEENVRQAISLDLTGLTFTEHFDTHPDEWEACLYDDRAYSEAIRQLRRQYGSAIFVGKGIEVCYQPDRMDFVLDFLSRHEFDLVILAVHFFGDHPIDIEKHWDDVTPEEGTRRYLARVLEAVRFCERLHKSKGHIFDVLAHLDLVKRYTQRFFGCYDTTSHADLIDEILLACLEADLTPEINTSSLRQDLDETMPGTGTVIRYEQFGGKAVSLGSDAHLARSVGAGFDLALNMLHTAEITQLATFENRQRSLIELPSPVDTGRTTEQRTDGGQPDR